VFCLDYCFPELFVCRNFLASKFSWKSNLKIKAADVEKNVEFFLQYRKRKKVVFITKLGILQESWILMLGQGSTTFYKKVEWKLNFIQLCWDVNNSEGSWNGIFQNW